MKRTKRLLALALAGVLAGQMGVVAWGTQTEPAPAEPACKVADHGKSGHDVTNVGSCTAGTHWLGGTGTSALQGGAGTNYYYVKPGDSVVCNGKANYIVVESSLFTAQGASFTIGSFSSGTTDNKICILGAKNIQVGAANLSGTTNYYTITITANNTTIAPIIMVTNGKTIAAGDFETKEGLGLSGLTLKTTPASGTGTVTVGTSVSMAKGEQKVITASPTNGIEPITYTWEGSVNGTKDATLSGTGVSYKIAVPPDAPVDTTYKFKCTAEDKMGYSATKEVTVTVSGCEYDISLGDISKVVDGSYILSEDKEIDLHSPPPIVATKQQNTAGGCNIHTGIANHGYTADWSVAANNYGVTVSNNKLTIPIEKLPPDGTPCKFTLTATLRKTGVEPKTSEVSFDVQRAACNVTPDPKISGTDSISEKSNSTVTYTLDWNFDGGKCTIPGHKDQGHGYKVTGWAFQQGRPAYVTQIDSSNSTGEAILHIDPQKLPATEQTLTLTATIAKEEPALLTNGANAAPTPQEVTKDITFKGKAAAPAATTCNAVPTEITAKGGNKVTFAAGDTEKIVELTLDWDEKDCKDSHPNHGNQVTWSVNASWASVTANDGKLTIKKNDLPKAADNKVTVTATITKSDNTTVTRTIEISANRPPNCNKKIDKITDVTGEPDIYIEHGDSTIKTYTVKATYTGDCDLGDTHNGGFHNETLTWEIKEITNDSNILDKEKAIVVKTVENNTGELTIRSDKLRVGTYTVTLLIKDASGQTKATSPVHIYCTTPDDDDDDSDHWEAYEDKIEDAKRGSTVKMDLTGNGEVPFYVFESARGRDVTLQMKAGKNYTWTINGKAMKKWPAGQIYLPLEVETLKDKTLTRLCRDSNVRTFKLRHEGSFYGDMKLTVDVGVGNAKKTMYLYSYNEDKERLTYQSCALADNDGDVTFVMTRSLGAYAVTSKALYGEKPVSGGGGLVNGSGSGPTTVYPPVAPAVPSSSQSPSSSSSSSSGSESSSQSEPALPPEPPASSQEPAAPADTDTKPKDSIPVLVPVLILAIAGVITATVLVVRSSRGRLDDFDD